MGRTLLLDTETSGLTEPRLVAVAWFDLGPPPECDRQDKFYSGYHPGKPIECGAMATHHITDEDVACLAPHTEFRLPEDTEYLIGHQIDYDWGVLQACGPQPQPKRICTLALSRWLWPQADCHSLLAMIYYLDRDTAKKFAGRAHGADIDVLLGHILLRKIVEALPPFSWAQLWETSETARVPTHWTVGKYKAQGLKIEEAPLDYRQWFLRQPDVDPYLRKAIEQTMPDRARR